MQVGVYIPLTRGMREMEDGLEFSVNLCHASFMSSDLYQKQFEFRMSVLQSLKSENK